MKKLFLVAALTVVHGLAIAAPRQPPHIEPSTAVEIASPQKTTKPVAREWRLFETSAGLNVVVPKSWGEDRAKYLAVGAELCPTTGCAVSFWHNGKDIPQDFVQRSEPYYVDRKVAQYVQRPNMQDPWLSFGCPIIHDECTFVQSAMPQVIGQPADATDWKLVRAKRHEKFDAFFVVVPPSYSTDRDRYAIVANVLCHPKKECFVDFWFDEAKVPTRDAIWEPWTDDQANSEAAMYGFFIPDDLGISGVRLPCRLSSKQSRCIPEQRNGERVSNGD